MNARGLLQGPMRRGAADIYYRSSPCLNYDGIFIYNFNYLEVIDGAQVEEWVLLQLCPPKHLPRKIRG